MLRSIPGPGPGPGTRARARDPGQWARGPGQYVRFLVRQLNGFRVRAQVELCTICDAPFPQQKV